MHKHCSVVSNMTSSPLLPWLSQDNCPDMTNLGFGFHQKLHPIFFEKENIRLADFKKGFLRI